MKERFYSLLHQSKKIYERAHSMSQELKSNAPSFSFRSIDSNKKLKSELMRYVKEFGVGGAVRLPVPLAYWLGQGAIATLHEMGYLGHMAEVSPQLVFTAVIAALAANNVAAYYLLREGRGPVNINTFFANKVLDGLGERTRFKCATAVVVCNIDQIIIELNKLGVTAFNPGLYNGMSLFIAAGVSTEGIINATRLFFMRKNEKVPDNEIAQNAQIRVE